MIIGFVFVPAEYKSVLPHRGKTTGSPSKEKTAHDKPRREASEETTTVGTMILDVYHPEL